ncbi:hypothetical protein LWI29_034460 [Acer saccharum]|uniref:Jacalin-type lectin domain-containing protein n=1 Tax=Acer saccharum TaxID=4024 RepID=A0AA39RKE0_ACESA|nr:hypothetical protein LWI29_034460 [Acer saccharum]
MAGGSRRSARSRIKSSTDADEDEPLRNTRINSKNRRDSSNSLRLFNVRLEIVLGFCILSFLVIFFLIRRLVNTVEENQRPRVVTPFPAPKLMDLPMGTIKLGTWGSEGGFHWDFNLGSDAVIIEILIGHGDVVDWVAFKVFNADGRTVSSGRHGGSGGKTEKITMVPGEILTSISGTTTEYFTNVIVESLTFHTTERVYGPYGLTNGSPFNIPMENGEIVGFYGKAGDFVDSIGFQIVIASSIIEIVICHGDVVDSVAFKSFNSATGQTVSYGKHGGNGGVSDTDLLSKCGPFGLTTDSAFEIPMEKGEIVGFFGHAGD